MRRSAPDRFARSSLVTVAPRQRAWRYAVSEQALQVGIGDPGFDADAQTVGHSVGVRVVSGDLHDVKDVTIREPSSAQRLGVSGTHVPRRERQLHPEVQHRPARCREICRAPVCGDCFEECIVFEESAQTAPVMDNSIVTMVLEADDQCQQLPLHFAKRCSARHCRHIQVLMSRQPGRVQ